MPRLGTHPLKGHRAQVEISRVLLWCPLEIIFSSESAGCRRVLFTEPLQRRLRVPPGVGIPFPPDAVLKSLRKTLRRPWRLVQLMGVRIVTERAAGDGYRALRWAGTAATAAPAPPSWVAFSAKVAAAIGHH